MRGWLGTILAAAVALAPAAGRAQPSAPQPTAAAAAPLAPGQPIPPTELATLVDGVVRQAMARDHIAGAAVSVVQNGQVVFKKGYGMAGPGRTVDPDATLFRIASISKTFTWIAALKEVEAGRMRLDGPINAYLPRAIAVPDAPGWRQVELQDLMGHMPGFEDRTFDHLFVRGPAQIRPLLTQLRLAQPRRVFAPGTAPAYSNYGAALTGAAVASLERQPFQTVVEREIIDPLGLAHTTFRELYPARADLPAPMPAALAATRSVGYRWAGTSFEPQAYEFVTQDAPAGAGSSTAGDMARYMLMILGDGELGGARIYGPQTALALRTAGPPAASGAATTAHGFLIYQLPGGQTGYGHDGDTIWFHSAMVTVPALHLGVFVTTNTDTGPPLVRELPVRIVEHFYGGALDLPLGGAPALAARRADYAGTYLVNRRPFGGLEKFVYLLIGQADVSVTDDGRLIAPGEGGVQAWTPTGVAGQFRAIDGPETMLIGKAPDGAARLYMGNGVISYDRVGPLYWRSTLALLAALAAAAAVATLIGPALRFRRSLPQTPAQRVLSRMQIAAAALWIVACACLAGFGMAASNQAEVLYRWPTGPLLVASAAALLAAMWSVIGLAWLALAWRDGAGARGWSLWRKLRSTATGLVFAALAIQLSFWGLLEPWAT